MPKSIHGHFPGRENNYQLGPDGYCVVWAGRVGFGKFPVRCRKCVHRPLYTDRCVMAERRDGGFDDGQ